MCVDPMCEWGWMINCVCFLDSVCSCGACVYGRHGEQVGVAFVYRYILVF